MTDIRNGLDSDLSAGKRNSFVDFLRGLSIIGVVCIHFGGSFAVDTNAWTPSFYVGLTLNQFFTFAVPLFVFLSGMLSVRSRSAGSGGFLHYMAGRLSSIGIPYLVASLAVLVSFGFPSEFTVSDSATEKAEWLISRLLYYGVHPAFYFIPMIILLSFLRPAMLAIAPAARRACFRTSPPSKGLRSATLLTLIVLAITHVALGMLAFTGKINYYTWCRPNPFFWAFYFYFGLVIRDIWQDVSRRWMYAAATFGAICALVGYAANWIHLMDRTIVGTSFEHAGLDFAYARPVFLIVDFSVVLLAAALIQLGVRAESRLLSLVGSYSLEIYLWHLLLLYFLVWRSPAAFDTMKQVPELIIGVSVFVAFVIALASTLMSKVRPLLSAFVIRIEGRPEGTTRSDLGLPLLQNPVRREYSYGFAGISPATHPKKESSVVMSPSMLAYINSTPQSEDGDLLFSEVRKYAHDEDKYDAQYGVSAIDLLAGVGLRNLAEQLSIDTSTFVLELGCGTGRLSAGLAKAFPADQLLLTDASPAFLRIARRKLLEAEVGHPRLGVLRFEDVGRFPDASLSMIVLRSALHHVDQYDDFIQVVARTLVPGGALICQEPLYDGLFLLGLLAKFVEPQASEQSVSNDIKLLADTMAFYCRIDVDKSLAEDKYAFRLSDILRAANSAGLDLRYFPNVAFEDFAREEPSSFDYSRFAEDYLHYCMGFGEKTTRFFMATARGPLSYVSDISGNGRSPESSGVFVLIKRHG